MPPLGGDEIVIVGTDVYRAPASVILIPITILLVGSPAATPVDINAVPIASRVSISTELPPEVFESWKV